MNESNRTFAYVLGLCLVWGSSLVAIRVGLDYASPATFAFLRVSSTIPVLIVILIASRVMRRASSSRSLSTWRYGIALGLTNVGAFQLFQNAGMAGVSVSLGSVIIYTQPLLVAAGAWAFLGERLYVRQTLGLLLGWIGITIVVVEELNVGTAGPLPVLYLLGASGSWAAGTIIFKRMPASADIIEVLLWQNLFALVPILSAFTLNPIEAEWNTLFAISLFWGGVGGGVLGFALQFTLLRHGKVGVVSSWIFAAPLVAAVLGITILGERPHAGLILGGGTVVCGIFLVNLKSSFGRYVETVTDGESG